MTSQNDALKPSSAVRKEVLPFTVEYNPSMPNIGNTINRYWDLLNISKNESVRYVHDKYTPTVAFRRPKNLYDYLISSDFKVYKDFDYSTDKCNKKRCTHCARINSSSTFTSTVTGETFSLRHNTNCQSKNVIYLISCKKCHKQYVGQTKQPVSKRMNSHKFDITNFKDPTFSTLVATHFNENNHSMADFTFMPVDVINNSVNRLCKETFWIHKLKTLNPNGLNSKALFSV